VAHIHGAVYTPPTENLPFVAVIIGPDGEVLTARVVPSVQAGEELVAQVLADARPR
jgi:hypothetical protein